MNIIVPHGFEPNYWIGYVKGLQKNGIKFCVISSHITKDKLDNSNIENINLRGDQSENRCLKQKVIDMLLYYKRLIHYLIKHKYSIIHFTGIFREEFVFFEGIFLSLLFRAVSLKYIYTVHNILPHNKEKSIYYKIIYRFIYRMPNILLVHTELMKIQLIDIFKVAADKIEVISIGLNEEIPIKGISSSYARNKLGFRSTDKVILAFGSIDHYKGIDLLIEAVGGLSIPSLKLAIAGRFKNEAYKKEIYALINALSNPDVVSLFDRFIPNEEVEVFFRACDVIILPYRSIDQSGVVFLALQFGIPIIASDVGALSQFIDNSIGIIVKRNDVKALADAISFFYPNKNTFDHTIIKINGNKYRWENICKRIKYLYE